MGQGRKIGYFQPLAPSRRILETARDMAKLGHSWSLINVTDLIARQTAGQCYVIGLREFRARAVNEQELILSTYVYNILPTVIDWVDYNAVDV